MSLSRQDTNFLDWTNRKIPNFQMDQTRPTEKDQIFKWGPHWENNDGEISIENKCAKKILV